MFSYFNPMAMQMADTNGSSRVLIQVIKSMLVHLMLVDYVPFSLKTTIKSLSRI